MYQKFMKRANRTKKLFLLLACSLTAVCGFAQTWNCGANGSNVTATLSNGTLTIRGTGAMADYYYYHYEWTGPSPDQGVFYYILDNIPWSSKRLDIATVIIEENVTSVGSAAFLGCTSLTSIAIPNGVTSIGYRAFENCSDLTSIIIPKGVTSIGYKVFFNCTNLTSITLPEGVTWIGPRAFSGCTNLTSITLPEGVTSIGHGVFSGCTNLTSVTIPESVTSIGSVAFGDCSNLTSITIPKGVERIGGDAFSWYDYNNDYYYYDAYDCDVFPGCTSLVSIDVEVGNPNYASENGVLFNKDKTTLILYPFKKTENLYTLPNSVTTIEKYAFRYCTNLASVTIPNGMTSIGSDAFSGCTGLASITLPNSVTSIESGAFSGCTNLTSITLPEGVTSIGGGAFSGCTDLTSITIPNSVTNIGALAFADCTGLTSITLPNSVVGIGSSYNDNTGIFRGCSGLTELTLPFVGTSAAATGQNATLGRLFGTTSNSEMQAVRQYYTSNNNNTTYYLPKNLKKITLTSPCSKLSYGAFYNCNMLEEIVLPNSLTDIGTNAFYGCTPKKVTTPVVISDLFTSGLEDLTITSTCSSIPSGALAACKSLQELTLPFIGTSHANPTPLSTLFSGAVPTTLTKLTLVRTSTEIQIADNALSGCSNLTELTLSSNVKGLGENALYGCSGLRHIYSHWAYPPVAYNNSTFQGVNKFTCTLYVPMGSKQYYSVADGWNEFFSPVDNIQEEAAVNITAHSVPRYGGVINGLLQYNYDAEAKLTAIGNTGYDFHGWMENNQILSTNRELTFTVDDSRTLYAVFSARENADKNIQVQAHGNSASISWLAVEDAANYVLIIYGDESRTHEVVRFELDDEGNISRAAGRNLLCVIPGLDLATAYYYSLTSYDAGNEVLTISNGNFTISTVGADALSVSDQLQIYPNPAKDDLFIKSELQVNRVEIYSLAGSLMLAESNIDGGVSVATLPSGVYLLKVYTCKGITTGKIVKE